MPVILEIEERRFKASLGYIEHFKARLSYIKAYLKKSKQTNEEHWECSYGLAGIY